METEKAIKIQLIEALNGLNSAVEFFLDDRGGQPNGLLSDEFRDSLRRSARHINWILEISERVA